MKTTCINPLYLLLATLLFGVTACGIFSSNDDSEEDIDNCSDPAFANFEPKNGFAIGLASEGTTPWKWNGTGDETNLDINFFIIKDDSTGIDIDLGLIYLAAPSEGPDDEAIGTLTFFFNQPINGIPEIHRIINLSGKCISKIQSVTLSTNDARRGTGPEINGKLFMGTNTPLLEHVGADKGCGFTDPSGGDEIVSLLLPGYIEFFYYSETRAQGRFCAEIEQVSPVSGDPFLISGLFKIQTR